MKNCSYAINHVRIPVTADYGSLNIAAAVQVLAYEIRMSLLQSETKTETEEMKASLGAMESFYEHLERLLVTVGFIKTEQPNQIMARLRKLYNRARPDPGGT